MTYSIKFYKEIVETFHFKSYAEKVWFEVNQIKPENLTAVITEINNKGYVITSVTVPPAYNPSRGFAE